MRDAPRKRLIRLLAFRVYLKFKFLGSETVKRSRGISVYFKRPRGEMRIGHFPVKK